MRHMRFPLSLEDVSFWIAYMALISLIASEFFSPYNGQINIMINKNRLKGAALVFSAFYLLIIVFIIYETLIIS